MTTTTTATISREIEDEKEEYLVRCHCRRVQAKFRCNRHKVIAWDCNCSDCAMRRNTHIIIPGQDFSTAIMGESLEEATILYQWGTNIAKRYFCKTCGILPWYHPRSNPDGVAVTLHCIDWGKHDGSTKTRPEIEIKTYDGIHWEESFAKSKISEQSKV